MQRCCCHDLSAYVIKDRLVAQPIALLQGETLGFQVSPSCNWGFTSLRRWQHSAAPSTPKCPRLCLDHHASHATAAPPPPRLLARGLSWPACRRSQRIRPMHQYPQCPSPKLALQAAALRYAITEATLTTATRVSRDVGFFAVVAHQCRTTNKTKATTEVERSESHIRM